jgi:lipopolysaccharide transport system permease protein
VSEVVSKYNYTITPPRGLVRINWAELWRYRELLYIFVWRDIKVRYKQTFLGAAWAIFQPFINMVIFTVIFGNLAKVPSDGIPYPIFVYTGLLFWTYFQTALTNATNCLVDNQSIVQKVYFPRLILPISTTITPVIDFIIALIILFGLMIYFHYTPHFLGIIILPLLLLGSIISASGLGLLMGALNVKYRDIRYIVPFFIQILLYVTPVIYPVSLISAKFQWLLYLNPMSGVVTLARGLVLGKGATLDIHYLVISLLSGIFLFVFGLIYFRKTERFFADLV